MSSDTWCTPSFAIVANMKSRDVKSILGWQSCVFLLYRSCVFWHSMPRSRSKQHHQCSLCGEAGHNLATCPAPGASTFRRLLREERVRKKTESKQKGRKKVLPVRKKNLVRRKKSRRWLLRKAEKTGESVQNQSRSQKDRKQHDRWWEKKLDAVAKLRFSGEAGPLPFLQKGTFVWPFLHARLRQLSLQLELLQQTVFCNEFDQGSAQEFGTVFHGYIVAYDFANLCCCLWGCGCCGFVQNSWWSDSQTATSFVQVSSGSWSSKRFRNQRQYTSAWSCWSGCAQSPDCMRYPRKRQNIEIKWQHCS